MKKWWMSRTVWLNIFAGVTTIIGSFSGIIPEEYMKYITQAIIIINMLLRFDTTKAIQK